MAEPTLAAVRRFAKLFALFMAAGATTNERAAAERKIEAWLKQHGKTRADIPAILAQAVADEESQQPPPPDPRAAQTHPYEDPAFTPVGLVHGIAGKYLTMDPHDAVIYALWIVFTHVYTQFEIAPRLALVSEGPDAGKSTARRVASHLVYRPNPEALGTAAALRDYLDQGPGTILLDEIDYLDEHARRNLLRVWNLGHMRGAKISLMVKGRRKVVDIYAPMLGAGIGDIFERTQQSRTYMLHLEPYTAATKPERDYYASDDTADFDRVYAYLRDWAGKVKLNRNPPMTKLLRRAADNARGLLAVADSCGPNWGQQARDALAAFAARDTAAQPHYLIVKHGLIIFDNAGLTEAEDVIETTQFNRELRLLDLPDADWGQYRGAGGMAYPHPITHSEQAKLLRRSPNGIVSKNQWPAGPRVPGTKSKRVYVRAAFEAAMRAHTRHTAPHLRLVT